MYINFWYPVATSEEITAEKPLKVEILSLKWRWPGAPVERHLCAPRRFSR
jgi:hypothetical protein